MAPPKVKTGVFGIAPRIATFAILKSYACCQFFKCRTDARFSHIFEEIAIFLKFADSGHFFRMIHHQL